MPKRFAAALLFAFIATACGGVTSPTQNKVDNFSGTLEPGGLEGHTFEVSNSGEFEIRVTALSPDSNLVVGTALGEVSEGTCIQIRENNFCRLNFPCLSGAIHRGSWCVAIFDVGYLTTAETYNLRVSHP